MVKAAAVGLTFLGVIVLFAAIIFTMIGLTTWAFIAGQYFLLALLLYIVTGFLWWKAHKIRVSAFA
jgi:hypothetical protein